MEPKYRTLLQAALIVLAIVSVSVVKQRSGVPDAPQGAIVEAVR